MCSGEKSVVELQQFLQKWDRGGHSQRARILQDFLRRSSGHTAVELEAQFARAASLFLVRLTAWMRLSYVFGTCLELQLKAVSVFLSASGSHTYLIEFLEVGGIMILLEILKQNELRDEDRKEALQLLQIISNVGQSYKELICESFGVKIVAECVARSKPEETQNVACNLLESLAIGNPKYQKQVYNCMITVLPYSSPKAQLFLLHSLRTLQKVVTTGKPIIVGPVLHLLKSSSVEMQYQVLEFIVDLAMYDEVKTDLLISLVDLLKPTSEEIQHYCDLKETTEKTEPLPVFVQQAAAAKAIRILCERSTELSQELLNLRIIHHLLYAMGNTEHSDSQLQACLALQHFVLAYPIVKENVLTSIGDTLFELAVHNPDDWPEKMSDADADMLLSNNVKI